MKARPIPPRVIVAAAIALLSLPARQSTAATIAINDWYAINSNASASIAHGATSSPEYQNVGMTGLDRPFSYFDPVTLGDGETATLRFSLTLTLASPAATKTFNNFRFGLFTASEPHATTTSYGLDRVASNSAPAAAWRGFLIRDPGSATNPLRVYRKSGAPGEGYATINDANISTTISTTGSYSLAFAHDVARTFTLAMERAGNDLNLSGSYGSGTFNGTISNAFAGGNYHQFNAFGFYATAPGTDTVQITSARFSNVTLQTIPEPSSAWLVGLTLLGWAGRRRWSRGHQEEAA